LCFSRGWNCYHLRLLTSVGFLGQVTRPGGRTVHYRVDDAA
jgi:hypothetical protein